MCTRCGDIQFPLEFFSIKQTLRSRPRQNVCYSVPRCPFASPNGIFYSTAFFFTDSSRGKWIVHLCVPLAVGLGSALCWSPPLFRHKPRKSSCPNLSLLCSHIQCMFNVTMAKHLIERAPLLWQNGSMRRRRVRDRILYCGRRKMCRALNFST